jgi:hypothetical protein
MTFEKCFKSASLDKKKECEFREDRAKGEMPVCTGKGYCPFRESIYQETKRDRKLKK